MCCGRWYIVEFVNSHLSCRYISPSSQDSTAGCSGTPPICRQAQTKLEVALYMFLWSPDTEAVLVAMSCFRNLCEEADIRCGVDEVSVHNFLPNYNTFMEFASVSNMMSTGKCAFFPLTFFLTMLL